MRYYFDSLEYREGFIGAVGWAAPADLDNIVDITAVDNAGKPIEEMTFLRTCRPDVGMTLFNDRKRDLLGVYLQIPADGNHHISIVFKEVTPDGTVVNTEVLRLNVLKMSLKAKYGDTFLFKAYGYMRAEDKKLFLKKLKNKVLNEDTRNYQEWRRQNEPTEEELQAQRDTKFDYEPKFSIVIPAYNTPLDYLKELMDSIQAQTYSNWQLCIANGSGMNTELCKALQKYADADERIKWARLRENRGISGNTNVALKLADGDFVVLMDHDDIIPPNALYEFAAALNADSEIDAIYSDEDKIDSRKGEYYAPHFKSDFNIDLLCCNNYICHLFAVRRSIAVEIGGFDDRYDGSQDHDFILRCVERCRKVGHVPKILYHWRCHRKSTAEHPESKLYAYEAGQRAIQAYYDRHGIPAEVKTVNLYGWYKTEFHLKEFPFVSVLIPNKDHIDDLKKCIESLLTKATYQNYEIIVIENNSTEEATFAYYKELEQRDSRIKIVYWDGPFNYSAINNFGATFASGEYYLLLNNDTEVISPDMFESMLGYCMREDVGIVGAKLYYPDDTIQHAGVLVGAGGIADHSFRYMKAYEPGYMFRAISAQDVSCVTAACLMIKKSVYEAVGGLDEEFVVAYNDVDLCLKVREAGWLIVFDAFAELYHYESKSRGSDNTEDKVVRFTHEMELMTKKWNHVLDEDPYYNKNLSMANEYYKLPKMFKEEEE